LPRDLLILEALYFPLQQPVNALIQRMRHIESHPRNDLRVGHKQLARGEQDFFVPGFGCQRGRVFDQGMTGPQKHPCMGCMMKPEISEPSMLEIGKAEINNATITPRR